MKQPPARGGLRPFGARIVALLRAHWIGLGVLAVLLLAYALAGFLLVPRLARSQIETFVADTLHRRIELGELRFNPFTFDARLAGLKLTEADGEPLVALQNLHVNAQIASLWRRGLVFKEIELTGPDVELIVARDGSVNLARLAPPDAPQDAADPEPVEKQPLRVHIGRFAVRDGRLGFQDRARAQPFRAAIAPIHFALIDFRTDVGHRNAYSFAGVTSAGEKLEWSGAFTVQPLGSSGSFSVGDLRVATIDSYLGDKVPMKLASGTVQLRGDYAFNLEPLSLDITLPSVNLRDLSLAERAAATTTPVVIPQIDVQDLVLSTSRRDVGVRRLDVRGARIDVVREPDGSINLVRLIEGGAAPADRTPDASPAAAPTAAATPGPASGSADVPWTVHADVIALEDAIVVADDRSTQPAAHLQFAPIAITINDWSTAHAARLKLDARIGIGEKGLLSARGEVALEPLDAALAIDLEGLALPALQPYLNQATAMTLHSGVLGASGDLSFAAAAAADTPLAAKFAGQLNVDDLRTTDRFVREDFVKWRSLAFSGIQFQLQPDRLRIERIVARQPYARVIIAADASTNIARVLAPQSASETADQESPAGGDGAKHERKTSSSSAKSKSQPARAAAPFPIAIRTVQIVDGSANFADYSVRPSFATGIVGLTGQITGLSSAPQSRAKVALQGRVDQFSPVDISGEVNLLSADVYTMLALNFRNMELTTFNPYSGKFAGYNISRGKLSTQMKYHVEARKLEAQHHIVVDNLEFGDKTDSKDAAPIPVKLGVALLKDRNGVIEIDLPVSGTLDDPTFRLGPIIWKAILGLLTKVVTAPFAALGSLFGGGEELAFVDFQPGSAALDGAASEKLGTLAKALVERPQLRLNVPLAVTTAADGELMARQAFLALVPVVDAAPPDDAAKRKRLKALESVYRTRLNAAPAYPAETTGEKGPNVDAQLGWIEAALLEQLEPAPAALEELGRQRAGAVRAALLANPDLNPERVFMVSDGVESAAATGLVRMELKLE